MASNPQTVDQAAPADDLYPFGHYTDDGVLQPDGSTQGSPILQSQVMDPTMPFQIMMQRTGASPSGEPENAVSSQFFQAMEHLFSPLDLMIGQLFPVTYQLTALPVLPIGYELVCLTNDDLDWTVAKVDRPRLYARFGETGPIRMDGRSICGVGDYGYKFTNANERTQGAVKNLTGKFQSGEHWPYSDGVFGSYYSGGRELCDNSSGYMYTINSSKMRYTDANGVKSTFTTEDGTPYQDRTNGVYPRSVAAHWFIISDAPTKKADFVSSNGKTVTLTIPRDYARYEEKNNEALFYSNITEAKGIKNPDGSWNRLSSTSDYIETSAETHEVLRWRLYLGDYKMQSV